MENKNFEGMTYAELLALADELAETEGDIIFEQGPLAEAITNAGGRESARELSAKIPHLFQVFSVGDGINGKTAATLEAAKEAIEREYGKTGEWTEIAAPAGQAGNTWEFAQEGEPVAEIMTVLDYPAGTFQVTL